LPNNFYQNPTLDMKCGAFSMTQKSSGKPCNGNHPHGLHDRIKNEGCLSLQIHPTRPVSQAYCIEILTRLGLHEAANTKRPKLWPTFGSSVMTVLQLRQAVHGKNSILAWNTPLICQIGLFPDLKVHLMATRISGH
jgi:hypothetical protein